MTTPVLAALLAVTASPGASPVDAMAAPTDVSGYAYGADAVGLDPAAPAFADGLELQLRSRAADGSFGLGSVGAYGVLPVYGVTPSVGYEWINVPQHRHRRLDLGLALRLSQRLSVGVAYRRWQPRDQELAATSQWDAGVALQAASWLSLSAGVDALNGPAANSAGVERCVRLGAAVRPVAGAPWLTLAADTRLRTDRLATRESRLLVDAGTGGMHVQVGYTPERGMVWLGASFSVFVAEVRAALSPRRGSSESPGSTAAALTLRASPKESIVHVTGQTVEVPLTDALESKDGGLLSRPPAVPTATLRLRALAEDPDVGTVILPIGRLDVGLATVRELRSAVHALRDAGKHVVAELSNPDDKAYLVACAADTVRLDPAGTVTLDGFSVTRYYLGDALSKIGVRFDSVEIGDYKSAPDTLTRDSPRPQQGVVDNEMLDQAFAFLVHALVLDRGLRTDQVLDIVRRGAFVGEEALTAGLVDELTQPTDPAAAPLARAHGEPFEATLRPRRRWGKQPVIAVVPVVGTIVTRQGGNPLPGPTAVATDVIAALEAAQRDGDVAGVVLRVDSGGGDVYASELIWRAVRRLAAVKPVVASMGDVAASGGYYIVTPAEVVIAEPETVTGSIGIFSLKADVSGLLAKLGVNGVTTKRGEEADWDGVTHALDPEARARVRHVLQRYYSLFVDRVANGRRLPRERVEKIAGGRVYTGARALELGLVDATGGLVDAIGEVAARAGLSEEDYRVAVPSRPLSLVSIIGRMVGIEDIALEAWQQALRRAHALDERPLALTPALYEMTP